MVEKDEEKAAEVYYLGAVAGNGHCKDYFASMTFDDPSGAIYGHAGEAYEWLLERAQTDEEGCSEARIASLFAAMNPIALREPRTPEHAVRESFQWMVRAAGKGNAGAADTLALAYTTGDYLQYRNAVTPNPEEARKYASIVWNDSLIQMFYRSGKPLPYTNFFYTLALLSRDDPEKQFSVLSEGAHYGNKYCIDALRALDEDKAG